MAERITGSHEPLVYCGGLRGKLVAIDVCDLRTITGHRGYNSVCEYRIE